MTEIEELRARILKLENALLNIALNPTTPRDITEQLMDALKWPERESKP